MAGPWPYPVPVGPIRLPSSCRPGVYGRVLRRVVIEDYFVLHDTWGSAILPAFHIRIESCG